MQHECRITVLETKCFSGLQDIKGWTNDDRMMIACCNDGTRPVIFRIERIDIPENDVEREWLAKQDSGIQPRMRIQGGQNNHLEELT
jgi:hypothetical protein